MIKNILILGLTASLLFSISAGISLYLNPSKKATTEETAEPEPKAKKSTSKKEVVSEPEKKPEVEPIRPSVKANPVSGADEAMKTSVQLKDQLTALKDREDRLDRRQGQMQLILDDIRTERETLESLRKQVNNELKVVLERAKNIDDRIAEIDSARKANYDSKLADVDKKRKAAEAELEIARKALDSEKVAVNKNLDEIKKRQTEIDSGEKKNLDKLATIYDSMPAENAAKILQQMADSGKLDTAVKVLAQMKERQASKVLAEMQDASLAAQLVEKMRAIKRPAPMTATTP
jgi:flagellar motility protein MotE (MotC chaperone)